VSRFGGLGKHNFHAKRELLPRSANVGLESKDPGLEVLSEHNEQIRCHHVTNHDREEVAAT